MKSELYFDVVLCLRYSSTGMMSGLKPLASNTPATARGPAPITSLVECRIPLPEAKASTIRGFTLPIKESNRINFEGNFINH